MFFSYRTKQKIRVVISICLGYALLVAILAFAFPSEGKSFESSYLYWLVGLPAILFFYGIIERPITRKLNPPFWRGMSAWRRILLVVLCVALGVVAILFST
jgi:membrane protease YdiL (CAAX protease family)